MHKATSTEDEIHDLERRLAEAEATIQAMISAQVDAVVDKESQTPLLVRESQVALEKARQDLERIVAERTAELQHANDQLGRVNEELLQANLKLARELEERKAAERRQIELLAENRRQREILERLVREAPVGICILEGPEYRYQLVNPAYQDLARGKGELVGRTVAEVWPELAGQILPLLDGVYQTGELFRAVDMPFQVIRDRGPEEIYFTFTYTPLFNGRKQVDAILVLGQDTTEQVNIRKQVEEERARLRAIFDNAPEGIVVADQEGRVVLANPAAEHIYARQVPYGLPFTTHSQLQIRDPDGIPYDPRHLPLTRAALDGERFKNIEILIQWPDGQRRLLLVNAAPIRDREGQITGAVGMFQDITERKQVEAERERLLEQIGQERDKLRTLIESINDEVWFCDAEANLILVNAAVARNLGFEQADNLLQPLASLLSSQLEAFNMDGTPRPVEDTPLLRSLQGETLRGEELMRNIRTGERMVRQYSSAPIRTEGGQILGSVSVVRDISQEKQVEQQLRESEARERARVAELEAIMDAVPATVWIAYDPESRHVTGNKTSYELLRMPYGSNQSMTAPEEEAPTHFKVLKDGVVLRPEELPLQVSARLGVEIRNFEEEIIFEDGVIRHVLGNVTPLQDEQGQPRGAVAAFIDITERKRIEEERNRLLQQIQIEQARLEAVLQNMPAGVIIAEAPSGKLILGNEQVNEIWRHSFIPSDDISGYREYRGFHADGRLYQPEEWPLARSILTGEVVKSEEILYLRGDGTSGTMLASSAPILDPSGQIIAGVVLFYDITERQQNEQMLAEYAARLERSNKDLEDFAFIASHDLQEPLRKVRAFGELLKTNYSAILGEKGLDYVLRMQNAAGRMQNMIADLLTYSRVTTKAQPFSHVDLNEIAAEVVSDLEIRIEETGGIVEVENLPTIDADAMQMHQLLQNLIGNALKFHKPDVPPLVKVTARYLPPAQLPHERRFLSGHEQVILTRPAVQILIEDNGIGFDRQFQERIFQPFQRLHGRSSYAGSGIGLAICRKIVERHHGRIEAISTPGNGSTFTITLPYRQFENDGER